MGQRRKVTNAIKKKIAGKQFYKCANKPNSGLLRLEGYNCPLWKCSDVNIKGSFDESGYEIDHIIELSVSGDNSESNLQALCRMCHTVKTRNFITEYNSNKARRKREYFKEIEIEKEIEVK